MFRSLGDRAMRETKGLLAQPNTRVRIATGAKSADPKAGSNLEQKQTAARWYVLFSFSLAQCNAVGSMFPV